MDQSPLPTKPQPPAARRAAQAGSRDLLVYLTIPIVAVALALGLHLQLDVGLGLALMLGLQMGVILALAHMLLRAGQSLAELKASIARGGKPAQKRMPGPPNREFGVAAAGPAQVPANGPARREHPGAAGPEKAAGGAPSASNGTAVGVVPQGVPVVAGSSGGPSSPVGPVDTAKPTRGAEVAGAAAHGSGPPPLPALQGPGLPPPLPPREIAPAGAMREGVAMATAVTAARIAEATVQAQPQVSRPIVPEAAQPGPGLRADLPARSVSNPPAIEAIGELASLRRPDPVMGTYWGHRPGSLNETAVDFDAEAVSRIEPLSAPGLLGSLPEFSRPVRGGGMSKVAPPSQDPGPDERELETMQNLIAQLAAQLNAPRTPDVLLSPKVPELPMPKGDAPPAPDITEPDTEARLAQSVSTSIAALRATADTMREPPATPVAEVRTEPAAETTAGAGIEDAGSGAHSGTTSASPVSPSSHPGDEPASAGPIASTADYGRLASVADAVAAERIDVYLDPILGLEDRKARHFEVAVRLIASDGQSFGAQEFTEVAAGTGLLPQIDAAKLHRSARIADRLRARGATASLFSTVAGESLTDDRFLEAFETVLSAQNGLPGRLVFSLTQREVRAFTEAQWDAISTMAEIGLQLSLEDVVDLDMDFERLKASGFDFIKLDAKVFLQGLPAAEGTIPASDLCRHLSGLGLSLIVGHIDDEADLAKILGFGVLFGQGTLFGGARPVKVDMSAAPAIAAA